LETLGLELKRLHEQYGPTENHWYVATLGATNSTTTTSSTFVAFLTRTSQQRFLAHELMGELNDMADIAGKVCYAECACAMHKTFLERFGYCEVGRETLQHNEPNNGKRSNLTVYLMVRQPSSTTSISCHSIGKHHLVGTM